VIPDDNSILGKLVVDNNLGYAFHNTSDLKLFIIQKVKEKKAGVLSSVIQNVENILFFTRKNQAAIFANYMKELSK
jgi:hypothetical protein